MSPSTHLSSLPLNRRRLVELMWQIHFGRIEQLHVRGGQPQFEPAPHAVRTLKIAGTPAPQPVRDADDIELKPEWRDLFAHLDALGDGVVRRIELARGVPLFIEVVDPQSAA